MLKRFFHVAVTQRNAYSLRLDSLPASPDAQSVQTTSTERKSAILD